MATKSQKAEAAAVMSQIVKSAGNDYEKAHGDADDFMVRLLRAYGYGDAMDIYENCTRWYA